MGVLKRKDKRRYYRHPVWAPLRYEIVEEGKHSGTHHSRDMSLAGLRFTANNHMHIGTILRLVVTLMKADLDILGQVVWQRKERDNGWETGICFMNASAAFRARMLEQVVAIERFRCEKSDEGDREMTFDEAARLWVEAGKAEVFDRSFPY